MKILVTGANGYIGTGVVKQLLELNQEVVATDFVVDRIDTRAKCIESNIFELEEPFSYFGEPDVVLHLAWRNGFIHNSETHLADLNNHYVFLEKIHKKVRINTCKAFFPMILCFGNELKYISKETRIIIYEQD